MNVTCAACDSPATDAEYINPSTGAQLSLCGHHGEMHEQGHGFQLRAGNSDVTEYLATCGAPFPLSPGQAERQERLANEILDEMEVRDARGAADVDAGDTVTERPIPHDPTEQSGSECPLCAVPWPCPERKRQRIEKRAIVNYLRSDLYDVATDEPRPTIDGVEAIRWKSPLGWTTDLTYGEHGLVAVVHSYDGDHRNDDADVTWLDRVLP